MSGTGVPEYVSSVIPDCAIERVVASARFARGENHAVYRVSYLDEFDVERNVVVRISHSDSKADRARAERESAVLAHLQGAVSPRLLDFAASSAFAGRAVMCLEYIAGQFQPLDTASPEAMAELGSTVRRTHSLPVDSLASVLNGAPELPEYVEDRVQKMLTRMSLVRDPLAESTQSMFDDAVKWAERAADRLRVAEAAGSPTLLHGDVSAGNILWTPLPVLIDWEYARIGDPADEVGYLFGQNALRAEQRDSFWKGYGDGHEPGSIGAIKKRAAAWEPLTLFGSALYWLDLWSRRLCAEASRSADPSVPKAPGYYLDFAIRYLGPVQPSPAVAPALAQQRLDARSGYTRRGKWRFLWSPTPSSP